MKMAAHEMMPTGYHALKRRGDLVWIGRLGAPIEDADCDEIVLSPADYERVRAALEQESKP